VVGDRLSLGSRLGLAAALSVSSLLVAGSVGGPLVLPLIAIVLASLLGGLAAGLFAVGVSGFALLAFPSLLTPDLVIPHQLRALGFSANAAFGVWLASSLRLAARAAARSRQQVVATSLGVTALESDDPERLFERACTLVAHELGADRVELLRPEGRLSSPSEGPPLDASWFDGAFGEHGLLRLGTETALERSGLGEACHRGYCSVLAVGLRSHVPGEEHLGVLAAACRRPRAFSSADERFLKLVGQILSAASSRDQARRALRRSEERFQLLTGDVEDHCFVVLDAAGRLTSWNPGAERVFRRTTSEAIGRPLSELHPCEDSAKCDRALELAASDDRFEEDGWRQRGDGSRFWAHTSLTALRSRRGELRGFALITHDLTSQRQDAERERLLASIEEQRATLEAVLEQLPEACAIAEAPSGRMVLVNRQLEAMVRSFPRAQDEHAYSIYEGYHPGDGRPYLVEDWPLVRSIRHGEVVVDEEIAFPRWDGRRGTMLVRSTPLRRADGTIRGAVSTAVDVTLQKKAQANERFFAETSRWLSESIDYEATVERIPQLVVPHLGDFCGLFALEGETVRKVAFATSDPDLEPLRRELLECIRFDLRDASGVGKVLRTGEPDLIPEVPPDFACGVAKTPEAQRLARTVRVRSYLAVPLRARGRVLGALVCALTKTERRFDEQDLAVATELASRCALALDNARLYEKAQEAVRGRDQLLAIVSHDLKNPLGSVQLGAALLKRIAGSHDAQRIHRGAETIERSAERMNRLIRDLLDFASIDSGALSVALRPESPGSLLAEAGELMGPLAREKGLELVVEPGELPDVVCDRGRVLQVLSNLASNALKATSRGRVTLRAQAVADEVVFEVSDTGPGIDPDELPKLFDRYRRGRQVGYSGTGLGLAIARGIVQVHGGRIWAKSSPGEGSTFSFSLNAQQRAPQREADRHELEQRS